MHDTSSPGSLALPVGALELWQFDAVQRTSVEVFPDGCRDLIVAQSLHAALHCFVTGVADRVEAPQIEGGQRLIGVRLQPGAQFDAAVLIGQLQRARDMDAGKLLEAIGAVVRVDPVVTEALQALAAPARLDVVTRGLGASERSLQRLLMSRTGRTPMFWRSLARARRCARALSQRVALADLALASGYTDQSHMTRDMQRWFGASPTQLRRESARFAALGSSGYA
jgi:AraC-like DNA-binding protein